MTQTPPYPKTFTDEHGKEFYVDEMSGNFFRLIPKDEFNPEPAPEPKKPLICPITGKYMSKPEVGDLYWAT